ncbi:MAG: thioredoxin family protein, partial [Bacteriovoracaceae bacterium]
KGLDIRGTWLVCKDICIPGEDQVSLNVDPDGLGQSGQPVVDVEALKDAYKKLPVADEKPQSLEIFLTQAEEKNKLLLQYTLSDVDIDRLERDQNLLTPFLAEPFDYKREKLYYDPAAKILYGVMTVDWDGEYEEPERPLPLDGVFKQPINAKFIFAPYPDSRAVVIEENFKQFSLGGQKAFNQFVSSLTPLDKAGASSSQGALRSLPLILFFAFLGGLILNLMPCVLPVISLKLFSLIVHSHESKSKILKHNLSYTAGVVATFWLLAAVVLGLKISGQQIGWGFQLQSPVFVFFMMAVIFIMALNLMGLFEFVTPGGSKLGSVQMKKGLSADFVNGVLATILSTPCSAPFLGTALTFAFTTSNFNIFLILTFVGIGLASPFILTGFFPKLVAFLPRPGAWMEHLKKVLALTLLLTFVWLYDILSGQIDYNFSGIYINTIFVMLFFAFFFRKQISKNIFLNIIFFLIPLALTVDMIQKQGLDTVSGQAKSSKSKYNLDWKPWSRSSMRELQGQWVFMDFTADWCLTCKVNEKLVLNTEDFSNLVDEKNIQLLLADWTLRDDNITRFLKEHGIVGVPAYFIQKPNGEIVSLGEVISVDKVKKNLIQ